MDEPDFGVLLSVAYGTFFDQMHERLHGLGFAGFTTRVGFVLRVLGEESMSLREIADQLEMSSPAALKVLDTMERDGYVERVATPGDRRVRAAVATAHGRAALAAARQFHADFETSLGPDGPALRQGLAVITAQASAAIPQVLLRRPPEQ